MARKVINVALNGVTGRMGYRQHLVRSLLAIREQGGIPLDDGTGLDEGTVLYPEPILVGRSEARLRAIAERHGLSRWTTSLDEVLGDPDVDVYFDTQVTSAREDALARAIAAGKHIYTEKPVAASAAAAFALAEAARAAGITHGVVQDKLFLPGMIKLRRLVRDGFFGRVLSVRLEFGYWVFEGDGFPAQRPSWNYRAEDGGGIVLDMFPHWQYLLEDLFGPVSAVYARHAIHLPRRWNEAGEPYDVTADDAAYAIVVQGIDGDAGKDAKVYKLVKDGISALGDSFASRSESERVEALKKIEPSEFFQTMRIKTIQVLYATPMTYAYFGYEGEAFSKGGYLLRGFNDLRWLPEVPPDDGGPMPIGS